MKTKHFFIGFTITLLLIICIGIYAFANSPKIEIFSGINGEKLSVYTNIDSNIDSKDERNDIESEDVKAGDIIEFKGSKEIVIGVSEDGKYITMPFEDYENQNN